jgi:NAD dependent epimerase/dehydratase family
VVHRRRSARWFCQYAHPFAEPSNLARIIHSRQNHVGLNDDQGCSPSTHFDLLLNDEMLNEHSGLRLRFRVSDGTCRLPFMKILIPGGSGQVGTLLARAFVADGHEVVVLTRKPEPAAWRTVRWDGETLGDWMAEIEGADVVINLAGRNVNCRYTSEKRRQIKESRINSTRIVGHALAQAARPPRVWLQASTATIYAHDRKRGRS